jgi:hypothetical protein
MSPGGARLHDCCVEADGFRIRCLSFQATDFCGPECLGELRSPSGINPLTTRVGEGLDIDSQADIADWFRSGCSGLEIEVDVERMYKP